MNPLCCTCQWFYSIVCKRHYLPCGKVYFPLSFHWELRAVIEPKTARALRQWDLNLFLIKSFPKRIQMALKFKKPDSLRLWTGIINRSTRELQVSDEAEWKYKFYKWVTFFSRWPCRMIFAFSHLLTAVLIGPWQYLLLFCSQPFAALSNHSGSLWAEGWGCISLSLACNNWGCCISQRNVQFLPPPRWL